MDIKICKGCSKELPLNCYWRQPNNKDGLYGKCKKCASKLVENNILEKQFLLEKNIWICIGCKKELILNKENFHCSIDSSTGFRSKCKNCVKENRLNFNRVINKDSLDHFLVDVLRASKTRSLKKKLDYNIDLEFLKDLWSKQEGKCAITGIIMKHSILNGRLKDNLSIDRINSSKGYTKDNIQFVCVAVNIMKGNMTMDELKHFCNLIIQNNV